MLKQKLERDDDSRKNHPALVAAPARCLRHIVLLEPGEHSCPGILGYVGAVARPIVGVESVRRVGIDLELAGLAVRLARCGHAINAFKRDALIGAAVEPE